MDSLSLTLSQVISLMATKGFKLIFFTHSTSQTSTHLLGQNEWIQMFQNRTINMIPYH